MEKVFDCETLIVMSSNFLMFPQIVLILRNIIDYLYKTRMGFSELVFKCGLLGASGLLLRYIIKIVTLGESVRRVVKAYK